MTRTTAVRLGSAVMLVALFFGAVAQLINHQQQRGRIHAVAYFDNTNGVFVGDDVRIRGVNVGKIERIEPQPNQVKVTFWYDADNKVPADAKAVILSPTLVTARAIQLTPPYRGGPVMQNNAELAKDHTAVPVEWDDFREQLQKLTETLKPTQPGGVSTLGSLINTAADNLRGQGANIRDAIMKLSQAISALADHGGDTFNSVKNLATLVSALQDSTTVIRQLNDNLSAVTGGLASDPDAVAHAVNAFSEVVGKVQTFVADNRDTLTTTSDKLTSISQALNDSRSDLEQMLHVLPTTAANAVNLYQPAQATLSGIAAVNNFSNPITFLCGAIQAASRLGAEQSAKLCVQYLAPIIKNRQYNFPPIGGNPFVGATARPNELTFSEDWMRPDYVPPQQNTPPPPAVAPPSPISATAPPEAPSLQARPTDPAGGLRGMMVPPGSGS